MALTSSVYDHFIIWPSSVTLTFNIPKQKFQMALLLLKENNCIKLFWNPWINVDRSYGPDKLTLWPFYHLTFKCDLDFQRTRTKVSSGTISPQGEHLCKIILKSMHTCRSYCPGKLILWPFYHLIFQCDLDFQPTRTNFQMALLLLKGNNCAKLLRNPCIKVGIMARTS